VVRWSVPLDNFMELIRTPSDRRQVTDRWRIRQLYLTRESLVDLVALIPMDVFAYVTISYS
jgi:hypothetical protein